jgi:hypothetical protein
LVNFSSYSPPFRRFDCCVGVFAEESQTASRFQKQQLDKIKKDGDRLRDDLTLETRLARQQNNTGSTALISKLQDEKFLYDTKIANEQAKRQVRVCPCFTAFSFCRC